MKSFTNGSAQNCFSEYMASKIRDSLFPFSPKKVPNATESRLEKELTKHFGRKTVAFSNHQTSLCTTVKHFLLFRRENFVAQQWNAILPETASEAMVRSVKYAGGHVLFAKCDTGTHAISLESIEVIKTPETRVIFVQHPPSGHAHIDFLPEYCKKNKLKFLCESTSAILGSYANRPLGAHGDVEFFDLSDETLFNASAGGIAVCEDEEFAFYLKALRNATIFNFLSSHLHEIDALMALHNWNYRGISQEKVKINFKFFEKKIEKLSPHLRLINNTDFFFSPNFFHVSLEVPSEKKYELLQKALQKEDLRFFPWGKTNFVIVLNFNASLLEVKNFVAFLRETLKE